MKQCPCCGSGKVKEYKQGGLWGIICYSCGYDSLERDKERIERERAQERREQERERRLPGW